MAQNKCNEQLGGMPKLKTNCRTIIERGNEIIRDAVNTEDGIYAVSYLDQKGQMQWGIVVYATTF